jgi:NAD(P)-dependent dehydrogenase (short-subunit alcohol dehydrogenase family)
MSGKVCMITGANSGIGKVTARELARMGATVVMVCRDRNRGETAKTEIEAETGSKQVDLMLADLASQKSIRQLAEEFQSKYDRLHVLVNNAGVSLGQRQQAEGGLERTLAVNHLASFLLTNLLLELIKASAPARIINVTSQLEAMGTINFEDLEAEKKYSETRVYAQSKLATVLFTYELARRLKGTGVMVNCLHPGLIKSNFGHESNFSLRLFIKLARPFMLTPEKGAETSIYLASSPQVENVSGKYFVKKQEKQSSKQSHDEATGRRLWEVSAQLTGLTATQA